MRHLTFLCVLFAALLAAVVLRESSRPGGGTLSTDLPIVPVAATEFAEGDVRGIEVTTPTAADEGGGETVRLSKDGDRWLVETPFAAPADFGKVETLVRTVRDAGGDFRSDDAARLPKFDLSDDRATTVRLTGAGGAELAHFAIGRSSGQAGAFVRLLHDGADRDYAYSVPADVRSALGLRRTNPGETVVKAPPTGFFHDLAIAQIALGETTSVRLETPRWTVDLAKDGVAWTLASGGPTNVPFKASAAQQLVQALGGGLRAAELVDPARRAELGLGSPTHRVECTAADGTVRAAVGVAGPEGKKFYVRLDTDQQPDVVYDCTQWQWKRMFPAASTLFEFTPMGVEDEGLGRVVVERKDGPRIEVRRENGIPQNQWELVEPTSVLPAQRSTLNSMTALLRSARAVDFSTAATDSWTPEIRILFGADGAEEGALRELAIGPETADGKNRLCRMPHRPETTFVIATTTVERLAPERTALFDRRPLANRGSGDVTSVRVLENGEERLRVDGSDGTWTIVSGGDTQPTDDDRVEDWVDVLLDLEMGDETVDFSPSGTVIEVSDRAGTTTLLELGKGGGGTAIRFGGVAFESDTPAEDLIRDAEALSAGGSD